MKLIIEKNYGSVYAYVVTEKHNNKAKGDRGELLNPKILDEECDLKAMPQGYFEFDVNYRRKPRRSQTV